MFRRPATLGLLVASAASIAAGALEPATAAPSDLSVGWYTYAQTYGAFSAALKKAIVDGIVGLRVQPQPNQPAYSDQYATPRTEPTFTSPTGQFR